MLFRSDVGDHMDVRRNALLAHATQVAPDGFWMKLPDETLRRVYPWEDYILARSLVDLDAVPSGEFETDLFAGIRTQVDAS